MPRSALGGAVPCFVPLFGMKEFGRWYSDEWPASAAATTNEEVALRVVPQAPTGRGYAERNTGGLAGRPLAPSPNADAPESSAARRPQRANRSGARLVAKRADAVTSFDLD